MKFKKIIIFVNKVNFFLKFYYLAKFIYKFILQCNRNFINILESILVVQFCRSFNAFDVAYIYILEHLAANNTTKLRFFVIKSYIRIHGGFPSVCLVTNLARERYLIHPTWKINNKWCTHASQSAFYNRINFLFLCKKVHLI